MIKIEVKSSDVQDRTNAGGTFREQQAWAHMADQNGNPHPYPQLIKINLDVKSNQAPFPPGMYQLDPASVYVNKFGGLNIGRIKLRPLAAAAPKAA